MTAEESRKRFDEAMEEAVSQVSGFSGDEAEKLFDRMDSHGLASVTALAFWDNCRLASGDANRPAALRDLRALLAGAGTTPPPASSNCLHHAQTHTYQTHTP